MTKYKKEIGAWGESVAADWLAEHGYQIIARNIRTPYGEIDIIARDGNIVVFIEVPVGAPQIQLVSLALNASAIQPPSSVSKGSRYSAPATGATVL